jgi:hypothetical protein
MTMLTLPPGRTEAEAVAVAVKWKRIIWEGAAGKGLDDNGKLDLLVHTCTELCQKDRASGKRLATMAIYA